MFFGYNCHIMNESLLTRLFRSIDADPQDDIIKVAGAIIEDERKKGHARLAEKLNEILLKNLSSNHTSRQKLQEILPQGVTVPKSKRNSIPLAVEKSRDELRHFMVLNPEVEEKIQRIEKEYVACHRLASFGLKPRKKILLFGQPGCGKSMAAERIAWNIGLPFLKVRFEAVISSFLGESAVNLRNLFDAISYNPHVLLLDEFDFLGKSRGDEKDIGEMHRIVNILLHLLEEYDAPGILIATTNLESKLDKALFRRFDDIIELPLPGEKEIESLIFQTLSSIELDKKISVLNISKKLIGYSHAIVVKCSLDAAKTAVISGRSKVILEDFKISIQENTMLKN